MTASILAICAALVPLAVWLVRRHMAKKDDPEEQRREADSEIDQAIATGDGDAVNRLITDNLRRLQDPNHRDSRGQGGGANGG